MTVQPDRSSSGAIRSERVRRGWVGRRGGGRCAMCRRLAQRLYMVPGIHESCDLCIDCAWKAGETNETERVDKEEGRRV